MVGGDEIDVVYMVSPDHFFDFREQYFQILGRAETLVRDLVILAKGTSKRATRKKHRAGAVGTADGRFFSKMRSYIGHPHLI